MILFCCPFVQQTFHGFIVTPYKNNAPRKCSKIITLYQYIYVLHQRKIAEKCEIGLATELLSNSMGLASFMITEKKLWS